ncbi:orotidine-5'-phosphate decarboxylase [Deinococcus maricopensis]|uniref:Orotidine 5'-phosphate decarboxylase n=1 Tax=Deinococcus maricopensis (strain DSM 21211 / LMG 22137 / NRRL B-23946 / LB-34) TaxID=709986 RepID=E8U5Y1_DEIML|nr:orotidine-5'-phosphate decarboxylase [Deinococcus maricopensis]ADV66470.1 Orotidine 5'-phosphate decarboxylase [Deinococcus maricopensis DSM 21211]
MTFAARLTERTLRLNTRLCVGLDPRADAYADFAALRAHTLAVLDATHAYAACMKPQLAFFEALGLPGLQLLEEVCAAARALDLPIILDAKRGDIGSTAEAYARAWLSGGHAGDALTVNPFLGFGTLLPFVTAARANGGAVFVLVKTSNPDQADVQGGGVSERVADEVARLSAPEAEALSSVGAVVGATHPQELAAFRARMPKAVLLLPGLGAQGGRAEDLAAAFLPGGVGAVVNASRGVQYAAGVDVDAAVEAARGFRDALNAVV